MRRSRSYQSGRRISEKHFWHGSRITPVRKKASKRKNHLGMPLEAFKHATARKSIWLWKIHRSKVREGSIDIFEKGEGMLTDQTSCFVIWHRSTSCGQRKKHLKKSEIIKEIDSRPKTQQNCSRLPFGGVNFWNSGVRSAEIGHIKIYTTLQDWGIRLKFWAFFVKVTVRRQRTTYHSYR